MKYIFSTFLILVASLCLVRAQNLMPNGNMSNWSFKDGSQTNRNPVPDGFYRDAGATESDYSIGVEKFEQNNLNTLKLAYRNDNSTGTTRFFSTPYMNLVPGTYELTFYVKGSGFIRSIALCNNKATNTQRRSAYSYSDTTITNVPMGTTASQAVLFDEWTVYSVTYTVSKADDYNLSFASNNRNGDNSKPFLIANISFENLADRTPDNYYIDAVSGLDSNDGKKPQSPWKNIRRLNQRNFVPGDTVFFSRNSVWFEHLSPKGSGNEGNPIVVSSYGTGYAPLLVGNPDRTGEGVVNLTNQSYWEISDLEITNDAPQEGDRRGVQIRALNGGTITHIHLKNLHIHHIKGIPGNTMTEKQTAGIYFIVDDDASVNTRFHDILIDGCLIHHVDNQGIALRHRKLVDYPGEGNWDNQKFTKVVIRNNIIHNISKNAMLLRMMEGGVIEKNICFETATKTTGNTMYTCYVSTSVFQYNEGFRNISHAFDGCMYDPDLQSLNTLWQYSYSHDNAHGLLWICTQDKDTVTVKNNISQNDRGYLVYANYEFKKAQISNNLFHAGKTVMPFLIREHPTRKHGPFLFKNNVVYNESSQMTFEHDAQIRLSAGVNINNRDFSGNIYKKNPLLNPLNLEMGETTDESGLSALKKYHRGFIKSDVIDILTNHTVDIFMHQTPTDNIIATINDIPAYRFELEREKRRIRPLMLSAGQPEIDEQVLQTSAMQALTRIKVQQEWMIQKGLPEGNIISAVEQLREKENNFRKNNTDQNLIVIGPDYFSEDGFWDYFFANAVEALKKTMLSNELSYTQSELEAHCLVGDKDRIEPLWELSRLDFYKSAVDRALVDKKYNEFFDAKTQDAAIVYTSTSISDSKTDNKISDSITFYVNGNNQIEISGSQFFMEINIYDIGGRMIEHDNKKTSQYISKPLRTGIYIVVAKLPDNVTRTHKCIIK